MEEWEILELIRRAQEGVPLNDAQKEAILEWLKRRMSDGTLRAFEEDLVPGAPKPPWWTRFLRWLRTPGGFLRGGGYLALAYLLIAAIHDTTVVQKPIAGGFGACSIASGGKPVDASESAPGPNGALKDSLAEMDTKCAGSGLVCAAAPTATPACLPDVAVQTVDIKSRLFWYTADTTGVCQCWLK